ncbi:nucleotidyltransferase family protein [Polycladidibacter stylochi]|uniref:nucleotidyltransferase family protein n=1 Tax=Polycladidibacter stylochi TaxID=1807766 RepID=UPI0008331053|nr:nucleotidyltransferase family protein [Pseudovibrio stylochi]
MASSQVEDTITLEDRLKKIILDDPVTMELLHIVNRLQLKQCWLVSGAIYQNVWNTLSNKPLGNGIKDYDIIYYDADDLSYDGEDKHIGTLNKLSAHMRIEVELKNQARVHLWYPKRFQCPYPQLQTALQSLLYYASTTHSVAVRLSGRGELEIHAPFGLEDIFSMIIRPNYALNNQKSYVSKAMRQQSIWPQLTVLPWENDLTK